MSDKDQIVALDDSDIRLLLAQAEVLDTARKNADKAFEAVADQIRALLGEATVGTVDGVEVVTNRWQNRAGADLKKLKSEFPGIYDAVVKHTRYRKLDRKPKHKR
jgi:predicted phage-related endonuclease